MPSIPKCEFGTRLQVQKVSPTNGALFVGVLPRAEHLGFRNGDTLFGRVTNNISDEVMVAIRPDGTAWMGVMGIYDCARFTVGTEKEHTLLRFDECILIELQMRQTAKGKHPVPVLPKDVCFAKYNNRKKEVKVA